MLTWLTRCLVLCRWMGLKSVRLELFLTIGHMWKKLVRFLGLRFWYVVIPLASEILICTVSIFLALLITSVDLKIWIVNIPNHGQYDCTILVLVF